MTDAVVDQQRATAAQDDELPDTSLLWRWVGKATRPVIGWILVGAGCLMILIGWIGVSGEALVAKQIPYLVSGGIFGMTVVAVGAFLLGTEDLRRQLARVDRLERMVEELHGVLLQQAEELGFAPGSDNGRRTGAEGPMVALPRGRSFHREGCSMIEGKRYETVGEAEVRERDLQPCSLCEPALS